MRNCFADQTRRVVHQLYLTTETRRSTALAFHRWQAFPIQNHIPQQPVVGMIQIAMHRVEIKSDDTSAVCWKIQDCSVSFEIICAFHSAAHYHFGLFFFHFFFLIISSISRSGFGKRVPHCITIQRRSAGRTYKFDKIWRKTELISGYPYAIG